MKTTAMGVILELTEAQQVYLDNLMTRYCAAVRWSFKRLLDGRKTQETRKAVQGKFNLNSRQANDAVYEAQATIKSQLELVKLNHENAQNRGKVTQERINKARSSAKKANLQRRLEKEQKKLAKWQRHINNHTLPKVVFGGKSNFRDRCKGKITREEWQATRNSRYLSRGDKTKGGNLNTRLYTVNNQIYLDIAAEPAETQRSIRYNRLTLPVYLAHKPSKKTGKIKGRNYRQMVVDYLMTGQAYRVEIIRQNQRYYLRVTVEEETLQPVITYNGATSLDTNPGGLGIIIADYLGQYKGSFWLSQGEWTYARSNKRNNLIGEAAKIAVEIAKQTGTILVVEDLKFRNDKGITRKFNRMSHGFVWSKFLEAVERRAVRERVALVKVKPPFTSVIGILKYQQQYGISNHEAASYVVARRGLGYETEKVPSQLTRKFINEKKQVGFQHLNNWQQWSVIRKAITLKIKKKGGASLVSWQHYRKELLL